MTQRGGGVAPGPWYCCGVCFAQPDPPSRNGLSRLTAWHLRAQGGPRGAKLEEKMAEYRSMLEPLNSRVRHSLREGEAETLLLLNSAVPVLCLLDLDVLPAQVLYILKAYCFITNDGVMSSTKPLFTTSRPGCVSRSLIARAPASAHLLAELDHLILSCPLTYGLQTMKVVNSYGSELLISSGFVAQRGCTGAAGYFWQMLLSQRSFYQQS